MTDTTNNEWVKRALYLKEKISEKDELHDKESPLINILNCQKIQIKTELFHIREKIRCFSFTIREMNEDIFSLELASSGKKRLEKLREQTKVRREILEELINEEKILNSWLEPIKKEIDSLLSKQRALYEEARELREEYELLLLMLNENDLPVELENDYYNLQYEEEYSDDNSIEEEEPEEPEIKPFFVYDTCCACQEEKPSIFNIPCGHVCLCISCNAKNASINNNCAICRKEIKRYYEIKHL